jgi:outer membrane protein assembly factor BamE (lipoprotein component of BamABCDE complex)
MKIKNLFIFLILIIELGCASPIERVNEIKPETEKNSLTVGKVQQTIKKGMTQTEVVEALGSPNMVTKDKENIETWVYDKLRTEIISASANDKVGLVLGTNFGGDDVGVAGGASRSNSANNTIRSQKTLTIILKFKKGMLDQYTYNASSF